jgi:hypothetical protein
MREHNVNKLNNFIMGWYTDENNLCDEIIKYHKNHPEKQIEGLTGYNGISVVNKEEKDSIDVVFDEPSLSFEYSSLLQKCCKEYGKKYPWSNNYGFWKIIETTNIQYYLPGGGFKTWHTERGNASPVNCTRHLVFMTYLNDVTDSGETEFFHQEIKIKPEKGLTLIWPADWTFTHRGIVSPTQEKYIVTGWFNYY